MAKAAPKSPGKKPVAKKTSKSPAKAVASSAKETPATTAKSRQLKTPLRRFHRTPKQFRPVRRLLPSAWQLLGRSLVILKQHWKIFAGITAIYAVFNLVLVHGLVNGNGLITAKNNFTHLFGTSTGRFTTGLTLFAYLLRSSGSSASPSAGAYQAALVIVVSLAVIWSLRQVYAGVVVKVRDGFYRGMYPIIPFVLVLLIIGVQLIPFLVGGAVYSLVATNGIAVGVGENLLWGLLFGLLAVLAFYMLSSSIFALYIVTLPDMTPLKALRSARQLVKYRRTELLRKLLFLPLSLMVVIAVILVPCIIFITPVAQWVYFGLSTLALVVAHSYLYGLYRELL